MESSIAEFLMRHLACEQLPTISANARVVLRSTSASSDPEQGLGSALRGGRAPSNPDPWEAARGPDHRPGES